MQTSNVTVFDCTNRKTFYPGVVRKRVDSGPEIVSTAFNHHSDDVPSDVQIKLRYAYSLFGHSFKSKSAYATPLRDLV